MEAQQNRAISRLLKTNYFQKVKLTARQACYRNKLAVAAKDIFTL